MDEFFERGLAQEVEKERREAFIIYVVLDELLLPKNDPNRLAVFAKGKKLKEVGAELLFGILGKKKDYPYYKYDENEVF